MPDVTIALAGNPNSGKTTTFNALTGSRQHVGNYPGVTVDRKEGIARVDGTDVGVVDLPGTYSITAYTAEEIAARDFLVNERPGAVVDVLDAGTLERSLYLAVQFQEMGAPLVLALNMMDEVRARGMEIDSALLSEIMGAPVVETVAKRGEGREEVLRQALRVARESGGRVTPLRISYSPDIDAALDRMEALIEGDEFLTRRLPARWTALKYLEEDVQVIAMGRAEGALSADLEAIAAELKDHCEKTLKTSPEAVIADYRYGYIASLMKQGVVRKQASSDRIRISDEIDRVVTHRVLGPLLMLGVLYGMFQVTFAIGEIPMGWVEAFFGWLSDTAAAIIPEGLVRSLVVSGIIDGVGGVLGFVPLIAMMFLLLAFLEDLGYMARVAYMLDRVFKAFGLHGSSVLPFIISGGIPGGCAVPGVMAARTLRSPKERLATILTAPFMICGAKIPVFLLLIAAFFPGMGSQVLFWLTLAGWAAALIVARVLRSTVITGECTPFLMELPPYRIPTLRGVLIHTWERAWQYIKKAGTVILAISIIIWAAMTFPGLPDEEAATYDAMTHAAAQRLESARQDGTGKQALAELQGELDAIAAQRNEAALRASVAGRVGTFLEPVTQLAGFDWRLNIALTGGIAAKEVIVSTLGTAYSLGEVDPEQALPLSERLKADPGFTMATAMALLVFTILYAPCTVTVVTIAKEAGWRWAAFSVVFNTALAFVLAVAVYNAGLSLGW